MPSLLQNAYDWIIEKSAAYIPQITKTVITIIVGIILIRILVKII